MDFRLESDSIGEKKVPKDAYYGVQSLRGKENFKITGKTLHREMIIALAMIKKQLLFLTTKQAYYQMR